MCHIINQLNKLSDVENLNSVVKMGFLNSHDAYTLQFTFGYQIRFPSVSSGIKNVQKYRVVLGFLERARAGLRVENHDPVPTLMTGKNDDVKTTMR